MTIRVVCPACTRAYTVHDDLAGKRLKCKHCDAPIKVPAAELEEVVEEITTSPAPARDEDRPRRRRREPDEVPIQKSGVTGSAVGLVLIGAGACLALVVGGFLAVLVLWPSGTTKPPPVAAGPVVAQPGPNPNQEAIDRVRRSTVMLRVELPNGSAGEGSGFFAAADGTVITNAHVLGMLSPDSPMPRSVGVIVSSGEPDETQLVGRVVGVDRENDLAVVQVTAAPGKPLPAPLAVEGAADLKATQKVYIFGFPLGSQLGREPTVSESSVSSLRRDTTGTLTQVQVNGGMHPGNSGGPVTDERGTVVAVSVAGIVGTQINFAVPGEFVRQISEGRLTGSDVGTPFHNAGKTWVPVRLSVLDPLKRLRDVKIDVWAGKPGPPRAGGPRPTNTPDDGPRETVEAVAAAEGDYTADVPLPSLMPGQVVYLQSRGTGEAGLRYTAARAVACDPAQAVDRVPLGLHFKPATGMTLRTVQMSNHYMLRLISGKESLDAGHKLDVPVLEKLAPDVRKLPHISTGIRLAVGKGTFAREGTAGRREAAPETADLLNPLSPSFAVGYANEGRERGVRNFRTLPPEHQADVSLLYQVVSQTWEKTTLPFPNREMKPGETWPARVPMIAQVQGKVQVKDLYLTCVYEGRRDVAGRPKGHVRLSGVVRGRGAERAMGKVNGQAVIDAEGGYLERVRLSILTDLDTGARNVRLLVTEEVSVDRSEGNPQGIAVPPG